MTAVLAHAGHWAVNLLYAVPLVIAVIILARQTLRDRRAEREAIQSAEPSPREAPAEPPAVR